MGNSVDQKILDRIAKCMALSKSSNAHEASLALSMAQKLMEEHKITGLDLKLSEVVEAQVKSALPKKMPPWELRLVRLVADVFHCKLLWQAGEGNANKSSTYHGHYILIGLRGHVQVAEYTANVLLRQLRRDTKGMLKHDRNSYSEGWVTGVVGPVETFAAPPEQAEIVDRYMEVTYKHTGQAKVSEQSRGNCWSGQFRNGHVAGSQVKLHRPVGADPEQQKQLG